MYCLWNSATFSDLEQPLTSFSACKPLQTWFLVRLCRKQLVWFWSSDWTDWHRSSRSPSLIAELIAETADWFMSQYWCQRGATPLLWGAWLWMRSVDDFCLLGSMHGVPLTLWAVSDRKSILKTCTSYIHTLWVKKPETLVTLWHNVINIALIAIYLFTRDVSITC